MNRPTSTEKAEIRVNGDHLAATIYRPTKSNGEAILFIHGWKSSQKTPAEYATSLASKGYYCLTFDLRGMGESTGDLNVLTRKDFLDDSIAAYDRLRSESGTEIIGVVGSSFGSYIACLLTAKRNVKTLVLRVPADFSDEGFDDQPQLTISDLLDRDGLDGPKPDPQGSYGLDALSKFAGSVLIVQSENDTIVDSSIVHRFIDAAPKDRMQHIVMQGAPHSLSTSPRHRTEYGKILDAWFQRAERLRAI